LINQRIFNNISILIVNTNEGSVLLRCLEAIYRDRNSSHFHVFVGDNASTDGSINNVNAKYPDVKIIHNSRNIGFTGANNKLITESKSEFVLFLNPDAFVQGDAITQLSQYLIQNPSVGVVGPKLLNNDGSLQLVDMRYPCWQTPFIDSISLKRAFGKDPIPRKITQRFYNAKEPIEVDWVMGSCLMTRRSILEDVGCFDERYFIYFEDVDLCYRIKKKGWKLFYFPFCEVIHLGGTGLALYNSRKIFEIHRSEMKFFQKYYPPIMTSFLIIGIIFKSIIRIFQWQIAFLDFSQFSLDKMNGYLRVVRYFINIR